MCLKARSISPPKSAEVCRYRNACFSRILSHMIRKKTWILTSHRRRNANGRQASIRFAWFPFPVPTTSRPVAGGKEVVDFRTQHKIQGIINNDRLCD